MFTTLNIVISLVFVLLLFSLLTSTVVDVIAAILSLKAKNMRYTLENMLGDKMDDFIRHPLFRQISYATTRRAKYSAYYLPGSVSKESFISILYDLMDAGSREGLTDRINRLEEGDLKKMMHFMARQADGDMVAFKAQMERWFDEVMVRSSDWYKRTMKWWVFGIGFALAVFLNADTIQIYQNISASPATQLVLSTMAQEFAEKTDTLGSPTLDVPLEEAVERMDSVLSKINSVHSPLGLGWESNNTPKDLFGWLAKLAGLLLTAIATTFGAPFWYDLLKKLLPMGKSMKKQESTEPTLVQAVSPVVSDIYRPEKSETGEESKERQVTNVDISGKPVG